MLVNIDVLSGIVLMVIFVIAGLTPFSEKPSRREERLHRRPLLKLVRCEKPDEEPVVKRVAESSE